MKNFMLPFLLFPFFAIGGCTDNVSKTGTKTEAHEQLVQTYTVERYKLFPTQNMWTFIMLDTYTGKNWQVQFSVKGEDYMFAVPINRYSLAFPAEDSKWTGRFQMFATQNMWTFILLDSYNGKLWQVQYSSQDLDNLMCIPINEDELVVDNEKCIFSIQPLTSMYQYYLINDSTGNMWKFQWSTKSDDYRWIEKF